jgi:hypothetical protein
MEVEVAGPAVVATDEGESSVAVPTKTRELYFAVAKFLSGGPCQDAANALLREITENQVPFSPLSLSLSLSLSLLRPILPSSPHLPPRYTPSRRR